MALNRPIPVNFDNRMGAPSGWVTLRAVLDQMDAASIERKVVIGPKDLLYPGATPSPVPQDAWTDHLDNLILCKIYVATADVAATHLILDRTTNILNQPNQNHGGRKEETLPLPWQFPTSFGLTGNLTFTGGGTAYFGYLMGTGSADGAFVYDAEDLVSQTMVALPQFQQSLSSSPATGGGWTGDLSNATIPPEYPYSILLVAVSPGTLNGGVLAANALTLVGANGTTTFPNTDLSLANMVSEAEGPVADQGVQKQAFYVDENYDLYLAYTSAGGVIQGFDYNTAHKNGKVA